MSLILLSKYEETFTSVGTYPILPRKSIYNRFPDGKTVDENFSRVPLYGVFRLCEEGSREFFHTYSGMGSFIYGDKTIGEYKTFLFGSREMEYILQTDMEFIFKVSDIKTDEIYGKFITVSEPFFEFSSIHKVGDYNYGKMSCSRSIVLGNDVRLQLLEYHEPISF